MGGDHRPAQSRDTKMVRVVDRDGASYRRVTSITFSMRMTQVDASHRCLVTTSGLHLKGDVSYDCVKRVYEVIVRGTDCPDEVDLTRCRGLDHDLDGPCEFEFERVEIKSVPFDEIDHDPDLTGPGSVARWESEGIHGQEEEDHRQNP